ncbi:PKD repeat-containing protein [Nakamurella panacisegetis]|uniref:PKD repeat-containing protein n=1 Tax=Nakamurella panacisegetis TaxID=1090615 RepID=A0A1H0IJ10_9ACTN|nr:LamG domain-containing protein [Nakamurella panacisegetis]SDO31373.1 PKD repeat-containing protein [Nakamurella panacisegetis]
MERTSLGRRLRSVGAALTLLVGGIVVSVAAAAPAAADLSPVQQPSASLVTADSLPTTQVDGVVWQQVINGNTVYAAGSFANARPAGASPGVNTTPRANLLAYDLTTGNLISSFNPSLNAQARAITKSPDGSRIYVGGDFTTANGQTRSRIAAYSTADGSLISTFQPSFSGRVNAIVATNTTVYVGGDFTQVNGLWRIRLAAIRASDGAVLGWNPQADRVVNALTLTTDGTKLIAGGAFENINTSPAYGLAALDPTTGALLPWNATSLVRDAGPQAAILSLTASGTSVYGSGYVFGSGGNLEGAFKADGATGNIQWIEDCHGDTYGVAVLNSVVYTVNHAHYCQNIGGFFQSNPWSINMRHTLAFTDAVTGTIAHDTQGYPDWYGNPSPSLYNWFPDMTEGTVTGQSQAAWTVTGNSQYVVMGGEFPTVNASGQQGLARFALKSIAPNKQGPRLSGSSWTPTLTGLAAGTVRVAWPSNWDRDDLNLTYKVTRNGGATPVYTTVAAATYWNRPTLGFIDKGLTPGATYTYRIQAVDPDGNAQNSPIVSVQAPDSGTISAYANQVIADGAAPFWRLSETSGTSVIDYAGFNDGVGGTGLVRGTAGAIIGDSNTATTFDGTSASTVTTATAVPAPDTFTVEAWFKTTTTQGGKIIGYGNNNTGLSGSYDRHVYMDNAGHLFFGVYPGSVQTVSTSGTYNDGAWHQVVASLGAAGMTLYVDGVRAANRSDITTGQAYSGFWVVGGDNLGGWTNQPSSNYFNGAIDEVAIYPTQLSRQVVANHYTLSGRTVPGSTAPGDAYGSLVWNADPDLYWRLDDSNSVAADASPYNQPGYYLGGVTQQVAGGIHGTTDTAAAFDGSTGQVISNNTFTNPTTYSEELWFNTTTTSGGKLIGFGDSASGLSSNYDRHVWMQNDGTLVFGTWTGQTNTITTPSSYNDGHWHHMVATQSSDGMKLYVDGQLTGTNPQTAAQAYTGRWHLGGDTVWFGASSHYFAGKLDDAAIYSRALSSQDVLQHYQVGSGTVPNQLPVAAFTTQSTDLSLAADGTSSSDPDGSISSYSWNWGDNTAAGSGATANHVYAAAGTYTVTLTVTDNQGGTNSVSHNVTVTAANQLPTAAFTSTATNLSVAFDGSTSSDPDGSISSYSWNWGDNTAAGSGATPTHVYAAAGTYTVTLTVTDNRGGTNSVSHNVTVAAANQLPTAAFTSTATNLSVAFDGSTSSDPDGSISSYSWNWGDNTAAGSGATPTHVYAAAGTYTVTLTVTDNRGGTNSVSHNVTVAAANQLPTAAFTSTATNLSVAFDGSTSSDPDGTIASYAWNWGDNTAAGSGATPTHVYAAAGTYTVTLTVTDNQGGTNSVSHNVTVTAAATAVATDNFGRALTNTWGTADVGGAWSPTSNSSMSVAGGFGVIRLATAGTGPLATLNSVSARDVTGVVDVQMDKDATGGGVYANMVVRRVGTTDYRVKVRFVAGGSVQLITSRVVSNAETTLQTVNVAGLTYAVGDTLRLRFKVTGSGTTTLSARVWKVGTTEPAAFQINSTDTTAALQVAGAVGIQGYLSSTATNAPVTLKFDNFEVDPA